MAISNWFSRRDRDTLTSTTITARAQPFDLIRQPAAGQELDRALTCVAEGFDLALAQIELYDLQIDELVQRRAEVAQKVADMRGYQRNSTRKLNAGSLHKATIAAADAALAKVPAIFTDQQSAAAAAAQLAGKS